MSRLGVLVTRRFVSRASGREEVTELGRAVELSIPPVPGMRLAFPEGGECTVSIVRHRCGLAAVSGVLPTEVELIACKESAAGLEGALTAGWQRVAPSEPAPAILDKAAGLPSQEINAWFTERRRRAGVREGAG